MTRTTQNGPPWPTVCCQKPTVPSQLASGKPVALCGAQGGIRTEPGSCPARWGSRLWGWQLWHGPPTHHHAPGLWGVTDRLLLASAVLGDRREATGDGCVGTQAAPPPTYQCPPLSGRSWPLLPLREKALFLSQPLMGRAGGGRWATRAGWEPTLTTPPPPSRSPAGLRGGKPSGSPREYPWVSRPLDRFLTCWDAGHPQMDWKAHP